MKPGGGLVPGGNDISDKTVPAKGRARNFYTLGKRKKTGTRRYPNSWGEPVSRNKKGLGQKVKASGEIQSKKRFDVRVSI